MQLDPTIKYPVFELRKYNSVLREHGRTYIVTDFCTYILDDKNKKGDFPVRRLLALMDIEYRKEHGYEYHPLYPIRKVLRTEEQLIVHLTKHRNYVDNSGRIFSHAPTTFYKLVYRKVLRALLKEGGSCILFIEGINTPIKVNKHVPDMGTIYAGILRLPGRDILYELSSTKKKDTRRKL